MVFSCPQAHVLTITLVFDAVALGLAVIGAAATLISPLAGLVLLGGWGGFSLASCCFFLIFLGRLALYLGDTQLAPRCRGDMLGLFGVALGGVAVIVVMALPFVLLLPEAIPLLVFISGLVWIVLLLQRIFPILQAIGTVREAIARR